MRLFSILIVHLCVLNLETRAGPLEACDSVRGNVSCTSYHEPGIESKNKQTIASSQASVHNVPPKPSGLITKTTGAIYEALSNVFSYDNDENQTGDDEYDPESVTPIFNPPKTTNQPAKTSTSSWQTTFASKSKLPVVSTTSGPLTTAGPARREEIVSTPRPNSPTKLPQITPAPASRIEASVTRKTSRLDRQSGTLVPVTVPTSTSVPRSIKMRPNSTASTPRATTTTKSSTSDQKSSKTSEIYSIVSNALRAIYSLREATQLNRPIRLAPENEPTDLKFESGRLTLANEDNRAATKEDVHLLCKLLHKHLENSTSSAIDVAIEPVAPSTSSTTTAAIPTTTSSTTPNPKPTSTMPSSRLTTVASGKTGGLIVTNRESLNESQESLLLESVFSFEQSSTQIKSEPLELIGSRFLTRLFNIAARSRLNRTKKQQPSESTMFSSANNDYETEDEGRMIVGSTNQSESANLLLEIRVWKKRTEVSHGHLHLVYWLLEPIATTSFAETNKSSSFRVLDPREATELLEELDHSEIKRQLEAINLKTLVLLAPYKPDSRDKSSNNVEEVAHTIDDTLVEPGATRRDNKPPSGLHLLIDRLTSSSFSENLHLYLILSIVSLLIITLCFALPIFCCRAQASPVRGRQMAPRASRGAELPAFASENKSDSAYNAGGQQESAQKVAQLSDSIWRKLSNTTTTLVTDQSEVLRSDGTIGVPVSTDAPPESQTIQGEVSGDERLGGGQTSKKSQFEWFSFEDRLEKQERRAITNDKQSQTFIISDKRKFTKSVQTFEPKGNANEFSLEFNERQEKRSSDTLTKSELVMIREKLVPIVRQEQQQCKKQVASQTSDPVGPDYVNQVASRGSQTDLTLNQTLEVPSGQAASRLAGDVAVNYIDSSGSTSCADDGKQNTAGTSNATVTSKDSAERRPKMRHLELPPRTRTKVEAIKAELSRLEQKDAGMSGVGKRNSGDLAPNLTYKHYDSP